jgi:hypothetical protein
VPKLLTSDLQADAPGIGSPRRGSRRGSADERRLTPQAKQAARLPRARCGRMDDILRSWTPRARSTWFLLASATAARSSPNGLFSLELGASVLRREQQPLLLDSRVERVANSMWLQRGGKPDFAACCCSSEDLGLSVVGCFLSRPQPAIRTRSPAVARR